jgi:hypothetical protein
VTASLTTTSSSHTTASSSCVTRTPPARRYPAGVRAQKIAHRRQMSALTSQAHYPSSIVMSCMCYMMIRPKLWTILGPNSVRLHPPHQTQSRLSPTQLAVQVRLLRAIVVLAASNFVASTLLPIVEDISAREIVLPYLSLGRNGSVDLRDVAAPLGEMITGRHMRGHATDGPTSDMSKLS